MHWRHGWSRSDEDISALNCDVLRGEVNYRTTGLAGLAALGYGIAPQ